MRAVPQPGELLLSPQVKGPGVNQHMWLGFCTQAQGALHSEAVGKLWTV